jgi:hypothetical protein
MSAASAVRREEPVFSLFERWPPTLFYLPVSLYWAVLALRYRSVTLPTLANPLIETGGLCGESKTRVLRLLGPLGRRHLARFVSFMVAGDAEERLRRALAEASLAGLAFPLVVKPDVSCKGTGVRVVRGEAELAAYLSAFPAGERAILQTFVDEPAEAGIFYVRRPGEASGRILSVTLKFFPKVVGDGRSTVEELVRADPRARHLARLYLGRLGPRAREVPAQGEICPLVFVGNHCKGALFRDGRHHVTPAMLAAFDAIAREIPEFYFGRFDVRCRSMRDLEAGGPFHIIEFNGAGSEATHIWDARTRLVDAYRALFEQVRLLFEIGDANRRRGFRAMAPLHLLHRFLTERRLLRLYPAGQ